MKLVKPRETRTWKTKLRNAWKIDWTRYIRLTEDKLIKGLQETREHNEYLSNEMTGWRHTDYTRRWEKQVMTNPWQANHETHYTFLFTGFNLFCTCLVVVVVSDPCYA